MAEIFGPALLSSLEEAYKEADDQLNQTLNVDMVQNIANLEALVQRAEKQHIADKQRIAIREQRKLKDCIATVQHWISMRTERIECGDEFGAEIQVTVTHGLQNTANEVTRLVGDMTQILKDKLNLTNPKFKDDYLKENLCGSYTVEYNLQYVATLTAMRRFYFQVAHFIRKNFSALQKPKSDVHVMNNF